MNIRSSTIDCLYLHIWVIYSLNKKMYLEDSLYMSGKGEDMANDNLADNMLTVGEVSTLLHVHPNTLRRWSDKGLIKSYSITPRGDRRFIRQDIDKFLEQMNSQLSAPGR